MIRIVRSEGATALLVAHDADEAVFLGDRVVVTRPNPGAITAVLNVSSAQLHDRSASECIALRDRALLLLGV